MYVQTHHGTVGVVAALLSIPSVMILSLVPRKEYETVRIGRGARSRAHTTGGALEAARDNDFAFDWQAYAPAGGAPSRRRRSKPASKRCAMHRLDTVLYGTW
ncbi:hypothetical protein ACLK19_27115 [Escherichia coli]